MTNRIFSNLTARLTLTLTIAFLAFALVCTALLVASSRNYEQEVSQKMHLDLAQYVVDHYSFFKDGEADLAAAEHTFHDLMLMGPNFEFYLLDASGKILAYSAKPGTVKRERVDILPLTSWKENVEQQGYALNDDPRDPQGKKVFSAAPIYENSELKGYLYAVIGSQIRDKLEAQLLQSRIMQWGIVFLTVVSLFTLLIIVVIVSKTTQPMRRLTRQIHRIRQQGFSRDNDDLQGCINELACWQDQNGSDVDVLGSTFKQAMENLHQEYKNVVSVDDLRKELLSHVSHDLRTPLASLLGYLETWEMQKDKVDASQSNEYISIAKRSAQRISMLIEQLFELAHLDGENVQVNIERFSIAELVQDVLKKFELQAKEKNISLGVSPQDSTISVSADIEKMERVFTNLIENALRHTPENGKITVKIEQSRGFVAIQIEDNGIGIPEEDLPYIFDAHFKAGNSVRENTAHGGLGLAITKKLLELQASTIGVSSKINEGTVFRFALPQA